MNESNLDTSVEKARIAEFELCLIKLYGVVIGGDNLRHILGYHSGAAFRQAVKRKQLPFPTFIPEGRHMRMARANDIAKWLASIDAVLDLDETAKTT